LSCGSHDGEAPSTANAVKEHPIDSKTQTELAADKKVVARVSLVRTCDADCMGDFISSTSPFLQCLFTSLNCQIDANCAEEDVKLDDSRRVRLCTETMLVGTNTSTALYACASVDL
jgi:hypothetical protein